MGQLSSIGNSYGVGLSLLSAISFKLVANLIQTTRLTEPLSVRNNAHLAWKWRNFLISFAHSTITGLGAIYCFYKEPKLKDEMINTFTRTAYCLICFSQGYFIYDLYEMAKAKSKGCYEIIGHHLMIISCFAITVLQFKYLGYSCSALTIELHNIFLHLRQLFHIAHISEENLFYRLNRIANIVSFVLFRICPLIWIAHCLIKHYGIVPKTPYYIAVFSYFVIFGMTAVLLYRLLQSDFLNPRRQRQRGGEEDQLDEHLVEDHHDDHAEYDQGRQMLITNEAIEQDTNRRKATNEDKQQQNRTQLTSGKAINGCTINGGLPKQD